MRLRYIPRASAGALVMALLACTSPNRGTLHLDGAVPEETGGAGGDTGGIGGTPSGGTGGANAGGTGGTIPEAGAPDVPYDVAAGGEVGTGLPPDAPIDLPPGKRANGLPCTGVNDCVSGFCVDGVCCNAACAGQCQACDGAGTPGTCLPVAGDPHGARAKCKGAGACAGTCNGTMGASCTYPGAEKTCGAASCTNGTAQPASVCDGDGACTKPSTISCDPYPCAGTECAGGCSASSPCAPDSYCYAGKCKQKLDDGIACADGTQCKNGFCTGGVCCNVACTGDCQSCTIAGAMGICTNKPATTVCRDSKGDCDPAETCTGTSGTCPADALRDASFVCRPVAGVCDQPETCTGSSPTCPATNVFKSASTTCRAAADLCDEAETCTGTSADCPANGFKPPGFTCRAAADLCDQADTCNGSSASCPNAFKSASTVCRPSAGPCDLAENCSGSSASCPTDLFRQSGFVCGLAGDAICDPADTCTGSSAACPANVAPTNTPCSNGMCGAKCNSGGVCSGGSNCAPYTCNGPAGCFTNCMTDDQCVIGNICTGPASPTSAGTCAPPPGLVGGNGTWRTAPGYYSYAGPGFTTGIIPMGACGVGATSNVKVASGPFQVLYTRDPAAQINCPPGQFAYNTTIAPSATKAAQFGFVTSQSCPPGNGTHWPIGTYSGGATCLASDFGASVFLNGAGVANQCSPANWDIYLLYKCDH